MKTYYIEYSYRFGNTNHRTMTSTRVPEKLLDKKLKELRDSDCEVHKIVESKIK